MRHTVLSAIAIVFCSALAALVIAQDASTKKPANIPADSKFVIQIDLNAIKRTQLGATLFRVAKEKAIDEFGKKGGEKAGLDRNIRFETSTGHHAESIAVFENQHSRSRQTITRPAHINDSSENRFFTIGQGRDLFQDFSYFFHLDMHS